MMKKKLSYKLAPALPSEKRDTNLDRINRWERANGMKMEELTEKEWLEVAQAILSLTTDEAVAYLQYLQNMP